ncbi:hypothetical protein SanaruYs_06800 [Chryseotalea sanaruensis]|uniref:Uncharacterized protein n=2 Tax=Chryseotalea sanaruensis TaxID=2482724 RepID=A0A401U6F5_9BACT|nr:hypothetical protein SanaruYs_06800 [Chryseotalea sanaruensis]
MLLSITSCSQKIPFLTSSVVPSAEGVVTVKSDDNKNYIIDLSVMRLADPTRLTPSKVGYIVWMETENNRVKNIGQLKTSTGFMSKTLTSSLATVTPFKPIEIFITGEEDVATLHPGLVVLKTGTFSVK